MMIPNWAWAFITFMRTRRGGDEKDNETSEEKLSTQDHMHKETQAYIYTLILTVVMRVL